MGVIRYLQMIQWGMLPNATKAINSLDYKFWWQLTTYIIESFVTYLRKTCLIAAYKIEARKNTKPLGQHFTICKPIRKPSIERV